MSLKRKRDRDATGPCEKCCSMFSTIENLNALMSDPGYQHWTERELELSIRNGCNSCKILFRTGCCINNGFVRAFGFEARLDRVLGTSAYPPNINRMCAIDISCRRMVHPSVRVTVTALEGSVFKHSNSTIRKVNNE